MTALVVSALLALPPVAAEAASSARPRVFALVVGNDQPADDGGAALHFADDDALAIHRLLREAGATSVLLTRFDAATLAQGPLEAPAGPPTLEALTAAWSHLRDEVAAAASAGAPVEFIFFFSGHGDVSHGEGFLALEGGRLTRSALRALLAASAARRNHVVIDACKSYFAVLGKGPGGTRAPYPGAFALDEGPLARTGFLLSSSSDGDSHEWERFQAGVFSFEVRSALRGAADADGDGQLTYLELGGFLARANAGVVSARFRPDFLVIPPGGSLEALEEPLLRWPRAPASLRLDAAAGHVYVEGEAGERLLDVHAEPGVRALLHLPAQRPLFIRAADEHEERRLDATDEVLFSTLVPVAPSVTRKGALHLAFSQLFAQPFGRSALTDFQLAFATSARAPSEAVSAPWRPRVRRAAWWLAGGAALVGLGASAVALERQQVTPQTSQRERWARSETIGAANATLWGAGVLAALAVGTGLALSVGEEAVTLAPGAGPAGAVVVLSGGF